MKKPPVQMSRHGMSLLKVCVCAASVLPRGEEGIFSDETVAPLGQAWETGFQSVWIAKLTQTPPEIALHTSFLVLNKH